MSEPGQQPTERVSAAVWAVVAESGIEATTVRAVAEKADCTTGLIMHHFGSRTAMLTHARQLLFTRVAQRADRAEAAYADPRDRLAAVLESILPLDATRTEEARVWSGFAAAALASPELRDVHVANTGEWRARITRLVGDAAAGRETDFELAAGRLIATTEGLAVLAILDAEIYPPAQQKAILDDAVVDALHRLHSTHARPTPRHQGPPR